MMMILIQVMMKKMVKKKGENGENANEVEDKG